MNVADRIQNLRKVKGISQEELADRIGVSRQAVSKWESEQSLPDIDKVVIMSEFFDVSTDYILRGIESEKQVTDNAPNANIFVFVATVLSFIGLVVSCATWYEQQTAMTAVSGLIFMAVGCMIFGVGYFASSPNTKAPAKQVFLSVNIWIIAFILFSMLYNGITRRIIAPYPLLTGSGQIALFAIFGIVYIAVCLAVVFWQRKQSRDAARR